jgi:hypothetical protein
VKIVKLKAPMPEFNTNRAMENFFKAVILIHQCDSFNEVAIAADTIDSESSSFDAIDYTQLKQMITNHRNRIGRNT